MENSEGDASKKRRQLSMFDPEFDRLLLRILNISSFFLYNMYNQSLTIMPKLYNWKSNKYSFYSN